VPELPEAETIARALHSALAGRTVRAVSLRRRDFLKTGSLRRLHGLVGRRLVAVSRRGKSVVFDFAGRRLVLQLGMSGRVQLARPGRQPPPHTHLVLALAGRWEVRCANTRRIAAGAHVLAGGQAGPLAALGPDADVIGSDEFVGRLAGRTAPVKAALMNQAIVAGVGNIYSDEALFRAALRPTRRLFRISRAALLRLHSALRAVLAEAIAAGGSTLNDSTPYAGALGELGYFTLSHRVYGRYGQPCLDCGTTLRRAAIGGRTSTYCPRCQR